jgi:hypothetical protein
VGSLKLGQSSWIQEEGQIIGAQELQEKSTHMDTSKLKRAKNIAAHASLPSSKNWIHSYINKARRRGTEVERDVLWQMLDNSLVNELKGVIKTSKQRSQYILHTLYQTWSMRLWMWLTKELELDLDLELELNTVFKKSPSIQVKITGRNNFSILTA